MKRFINLKTKMILSYLAIALITIFTVSIYIRATSDQRLKNLVIDLHAAGMQEAAQTYYSANGNFDGFFEYFIRSKPAELPRVNGGIEPQFPGEDRNKDMRGLDGLVDTEGRALAPMFGYSVGQVIPEEMRQNGLPVVVDGKTVAWVLLDNKTQLKFSAEESMFLERTNNALLAAGGTAFLGAVLIGILLANSFLRPVRNLMKASQALAYGALNQQVPVTSDDELGQLSKTFNQMSADLARADEQRRQMTADITHDLSSPLQVIAGYIEMLQDDPTTLNPKRIQILTTEIGHLRRLVGDLGMLSQAEAKDFEIIVQPLDAGELLERVVHKYEAIAQKQEVSLKLHAAPHLPTISLDEGRMMQVFGNLMDNALRYTPKSGSISLSADFSGGEMVFRVRDSGSGIHPQDLPYIFDRFYRADPSREANSGKMGLGLAITKALVIAQGGQIQVESDGSSTGTTFKISFPLER